MTDFNGKLAAVCAAVGAVGGVIARSLGGWDNAVVTLIIFMVIDYAMGIIVAAVFKKSEKSANGGLSSRVCWIGLARKVMTLLFVIIAHRLDVLIGTDYIRTGVIIAFCASELISICENAALMGVLPEPVKKLFDKIIDVMKNKGDK